MNENAYTQLVVRRLRAERAFVWKSHGHGMQAAGMPDLYVAALAFTGWIELKVGKNGLTPLQALNRERLLAHGVPVVVLRGPEHEAEWGSGGHSALDWDSPLIPQLARGSMLDQSVSAH